jgi:hypothetical protein
MWKRLGVWLLRNVVANVVEELIEKQKTQLSLSEVGNLKNLLAEKQNVELIRSLIEKAGKQ